MAKIADFFKKALLIVFILITCIIAFIFAYYVVFNSTISVFARIIIIAFFMWFISIIIVSKKIDMNNQGQIIRAVLIEAGCGVIIAIGLFFVF